MTEPLRNDSVALASLFTSVRNEVSGIGTARDSASSAGFNSAIVRLPDEILGALPRSSRILRRAIELHPKGAYKAFYQLKIAGDSIVGQSIQDYLYSIQGRLKYWEMFRRAAVLARQFGDAFILIGIEDGLDTKEPVEPDRIRSIRRLILCEKREIEPDRNNPPQLYQLRRFNLSREVPESARIWHHTRVLRFVGDELPDSHSLTLNSGYNDSVLQSLFAAWIQWEEGVSAGAAMLQDYDVTAIGIKGLGRALAEDAAKGGTANRDAIFQRLLTLSIGKSVVRDLAYDLENEKLEQLQRRYQGADLIINSLQERLASAADIPANKLFNRLPATGLATGVQAASIVRSEWAIANNEWADERFRPNLETLVEYAMAAKDSPTRGKVPPVWELNLPLNIQLSPLERLDMERTVADRDQTNIESGIYTPKEARTQYELAEPTYLIQVSRQDSQWSVSVQGCHTPYIVGGVTRSDAIGKVKAMVGDLPIVSARKLDRDELGNEDWDNLANVSAADFVAFAKRAIDTP